MSRFVWMSSSAGVEFDLTDWVDDVAFTRGAAGLIGAPPVRKTYEYVPGLPGAVARQIIHDVKPVRLPLIALSDGWQDVMKIVRKMVLVMDPVRNPEAVLRYIRDDGIAYDLFCAAVEGLEVDGTGDDGPNAQKFALGFDAVDPYWYGPEIIKEFRAGAEASPWFGPGLFPPLTLSSGSVLGNIELIVDSDVETWPVFIAGGTTSGSLKIENETTAQKVELDDTAELLDDESIVIDTRPRGDAAKTIIGPGVDEDAQNWWPKTIEGGRSLWALQPGKNKISLSMPGAVEGVSFVQLKYRNAMLTPVTI